MSKYLDKLKRILVLTPDAIGSTYFQRSLTVYLNYHVLESAACDNRQ